MQYLLGFGNTMQTVAIDDRCIKAILLPNPVATSIDSEEEVLRGLRSPIGSARLRHLLSPGDKIVIVTSDITRPMPSKQVLPPVLDEIEAAGCSMADVAVVFALGSHRRQSKAEQRALVGDAIFNRVRCIDSNSMDSVFVGTTAAGTPVYMFRPVVQADRLICLGNIEYHYFAGYSGGAKAVLPGVCTRNTIQANHAMMICDGAHAGRLDGNPIREDIESIVRLRPIDFIVNVVLDEHKKIIKCVAGDCVKAHREGCRFLDDIYKVAIPGRAKIVIASQGGAPKDINLYQAQKALDNAKHAVIDGGIIILCASCCEGMGEKTFERWMTTFRSPESMVTEIHRNFQLGGHKAAAIAMVLLRAHIFLVSEMDASLVSGIGMRAFSSLEDAYRTARTELGEDADVILMPFGGSTLPEV